MTILAHDLESKLEDFDRRAVAVRRQSPLARRLLATFDKGVAAVDRQRLADLQRYVAENSALLAADAPFKYLDFPSYLRDKSRWIVDLKLDVAKPLRILDLGVGGGHFTFLAKAHGHEVLGLDIDVDIYARILEVYGIDRVTHEIKPQAPLPLDGKFDLISALQITFNKILPPVLRDPPRNLYWSDPDWAWFIEYLCTLLNYPGRILLNFNRQTFPGTDHHHSDDLLDLFEKNGAHVDHTKCSALLRLDAPIKFEI